MNKEALVIANFAKKSSYIGDDAAVIGKMLYSQDAFFENVHFKRSWLTPYQIAYKAMLVNISDAIAMNAKPRFALITLALDKSWNKSALQDLIQGFEDAAAAFGCEIIGGDTIANCKLDISITIISQSDKVLQRGTLKEGDYLAYTGKLGASKKDLTRLCNGGKVSSQSRFVKPQLRQEFVARATPYLHAGMDISDGLFTDAQKLTQTINRSFTRLSTISKQIGCSGEEYEMLVGFSPRAYKTLKRIAKQTKTPLTVFAKVTRNKKKALCKANHF